MNHDFTNKETTDVAEEVDFKYSEEDEYDDEDDDEGKNDDEAYHDDEIDDKYSDEDDSGDGCVERRALEDEALVETPEEPEEDTTDRNRRLGSLIAQLQNPVKNVMRQINAQSHNNRQN